MFLSLCALGTALLCYFFHFVQDQTLLVACFVACSVMLMMKNKVL